MAVRAVWIVSLIPENLGKVLYSRKFLTVEKRAEIAHADDYISLPSDENLSMAILFILGLTAESKQFVEWRDKSSYVMHLPTMTVKVGKKVLWPVLVIEQVSCLLCCFPFVEEIKKKSLMDIPSVSVGFDVLIGILNFIGPSNIPKNKLAQKFLELDNFLTLNMPFGTPSDSDPLSVIAFYNNSLPSLGKKILSSGKHDSKKVKSSVVLEINEFVRSAQTDQLDMQSVVDIYGSITAAVDFVGYINNISVTLEHLDASKSLDLKSLIIHPCVQTFTSTAGEGATGIPKKLWFVPPSHRFTLCFYSATFSEPPVQGIFKLKGNAPVEFLIQLKLTENFQNSLHSCDVFIPFFNRGPILNYEFKTTLGFLQTSDDKHSLKWNIGTKFSSKTLEVMLTAKVEFCDSPLPVHNDPFCVDKNCYIQVNFKQKNTTLSGCNIDMKSVVVSPVHKAKVQIERAVYSTEYRIWNSFGDLPFSSVVEDALPKELIY